MVKNTSKPENRLSGLIIDSCYKIHTQLGPGLFESVYEEILSYELRNQNISLERQKSLPVYWDQKVIELGFRADLVVEEKVLIEIKSVKELAPVHYKQVLTYLKISGLKLVLIINFNEELIKDGIKRVVNNL